MPHSVVLPTERRTFHAPFTAQLLDDVGMVTPTPRSRQEHLGKVRDVGGGIHALPEPGVDFERRQVLGLHAPQGLDVDEELRILFGGGFAAASLARTLPEGTRRPSPIRGFPD